MCVCAGACVLGLCSVSVLGCVVFVLCVVCWVVLGGAVCVCSVRVFGSLSHKSYTIASVFTQHS